MILKTIIFVYHMSVLLKKYMGNLNEKYKNKFQCFLFISINHIVTIDCKTMKYL